MLKIFFYFLSSSCRTETNLYIYIMSKKATPTKKKSEQLGNITEKGLIKRSKKDGSFHKGEVYIKHEEDFLRIEDKFQNVIIEEDASQKT